MIASKAILDRFWMDETWLRTYDAQTKEQSKKWRQWFPTSKEVQDTEVIKQVVGVYPCDKVGIFLLDYQEKGSYHGKVLRCTFR
jgi:hypothetical protein